MTVTLIHEIVHAYMYQTLFDADLIDFDQNGDPVPVSNICNMTMNLNNYDLGTKFQNYICTAAQNNNLSTQWSHEIFNVDIFSINDYQQAIADFILNNHDWNNEDVNFINTAQSYFGNDWKLHISEATSWIGLTQISEYINYRNNIANPIIKLGIIDIAESRNQINDANDNCN